MSAVRTHLVKALARKYEAEIAQAKASVLIYLDNSVGIGEHPQHIEEIDKLLTKISNAQENLDTLEKHFDYDNIPF
jgi:uncharacterized protein (DUF342 family)